MSVGHRGPRGRLRRVARAWAQRVVLGASMLCVATGSLAGCGEEEPEPVRTAKDFVDAVRSGDADRVLALVDEETLTRVQIAAERASDQVGGRRSIELEEMFQVVQVDLRFQVASAELSSDDGENAVVTLTGADDSTHALPLVRQQGQWKVRLTLPRGPMGEP